MDRIVILKLVVKKLMEGYGPGSGDSRWGAMIGSCNIVITVTAGNFLIG
jgi:hypothetical protein